MHDIGRAILSLDLTECLQRVVQKTAALLGNPLTAVVLQENGVLRVPAYTYFEPLESDLQIHLPGNVAAQVVESGSPLWIADIAATETETGIIPLHPHSRCLVASPLIVDDRVIGVLVVESPRPHAFSQADQTQVARLATQAAIAIQNARLYSSLAENRQWLSTMLTSIGDAVIATDVQGHITFMNPVAQALTGWIQAEAQGQQLSEVFKIINEETRQEVEQPVAKVIREGMVLGLANHTILISKDGTERPIDDSGAPIRDDQGEINGMILIFRDISERQHLEKEREQLLFSAQTARAQAEAANRTKDEFLATVSHELRTPLNAILGWSSLMRTRKLDESNIAHALETIERNARSQNKLIEDLLDVSRIITGKMRLELRVIDIVSVVEAALDAVRPTAEAKGVRLQSILDPLVGPVEGDPNRLQQVVWNLLSNAIKFTPKGGRVLIQLKSVNALAEITVTDTGAGIHQEFLPYIFDRFRQADSTSTRVHGGLGLGLAIVRHLAELHGGTVHAHSLGEGQGATFTVQLPIMAVYQKTDAAKHAQPATEGELSLEFHSSLKGVRVLVVDDESDTRALITAILEQCGASVRAVGSTAEALAAIERERPDVLVSDIQMPVEDGYTLMRKVRAMNQGRGNIPAAALTAYARVEDRMRALLEGYQIHLPKPVEPNELIAVVATLADRIGKSTPI